jgi:murein DD-endopeptidase MepM/ murein hydrolase activator NlpD
VLFGTLLTPLQVEAGVFSSLFGNDALAQTDAGSDTNVGVETINPFQFDNNSQNIELLQANVSSVSFLQEKNVKDNKKEGEVDASKNINIVSDNALLPAVGSLSATGGGVGIGNPESSFDEISVYVVRKGDVLSKIAEMFDVSVNTILWANDMKKGDKLKEGDTLFILPVSGVKHIVAKGQTLKSIANLYKVDILTITSFNGMSVGDKLAVGDELIIPEAEMPNDDVPGATPKKSSNVGVYATSTLKNIFGYFINPVPELKRKSQGLHGPGNRGIDLAAPTGTRILASAEGIVLLARMGYNGGYGNMVIVQHPNGTKTLYGHMSKIGTKTGAQVTQGEVIGYVGSTGRSTGPHLHFEVFNAKNPGSDWSWKTQ